jgi:hypothetical protein
VSETPDPDQEQLARELAEQLRQLKVEDVLINTLLTVSSIGYRKLGLTEDTKEDRDLEQSRLAIETMKALTPVLEKFVPAELIRDFDASVANLQLAYAQAAAVKEASDGPEEPVRGQTPGPTYEATEKADVSEPLGEEGGKPGEPSG